jgi:hypothetical protein
MDENTHPLLTKRMGGAIAVLGAGLRPILETAATQNSVIQINSIPNCEECEDYGVELRKFFGSLQGWAVNGGVLIFPFDPQLRDGIHLTVDADHHELARRLTEAFDTAHIAITQAAPQKLNAGLHVVILVGKQSL